LLPESGATLAQGGAEAPRTAQGPGAAAKAPPIASTAPTLADLGSLYGGRDRLLRVAEVAEHLGVCAATVYRLCETGELAHVRIVNSIRIRPDDLRTLLARHKGRGED
jgi:excisionase family DNA binding protein